MAVYILTLLLQPCSDEQLKEEIPKELIAAFDLNREQPPQPGLPTT